MRLLSAAPLHLGVTILVLVGAMVLVPGVADGQDAETCLDCAINKNVGGRSLGPKADLTDGTHASLITSPDFWTVRKRVNEVTVFFTAKSGHKLVPRLSKEDIRVTDDNKPIARISAFGYQRDLPLRLGLLVDTSNSVNRNFHFEKATIQFFRQIVRRDLDRAFVLGFANDVDVTQDYSDDPEQLAAGVMALRNGGGAALFDAIDAACDKFIAKEDSEPTARILIVLSDGDDNSSKASLSLAIEKAQMRDVTIYSMNTKPEETEMGRTLPPGYVALKQLAEETGGRAFSEKRNSELKKAFSTIEEEMRNRYALSYQPSDLEEDGRFHRIQIAAEKSGRRLRVHTRNGYYARLASSIE
jgi:Ca-activated chloride channel family protein